MPNAMRKSYKNKIGQWVLQDGDTSSKALRTNASGLEPVKERRGGKDVEPTQHSYKEFYCTEGLREGRVAGGNMGSKEVCLSFLCFHLKMRYYNMLVQCWD